MKNGGTTVAFYEPWTKQDASVVEAVQKGPSAGLEDVAHDALSLAARIRDGLGLVANDARNGSRLATEIVNDLSSVGGDFRAARDAFRDYLNEAEAVHGDQAWEGTSAERREAILQVFQQVDSIIQQIQPQEAPAATPSCARGGIGIQSRRARPWRGTAASATGIGRCAGRPAPRKPSRFATGASVFMDYETTRFRSRGTVFLRVGRRHGSDAGGLRRPHHHLGNDEPGQPLHLLGRREPTLMESVPRELPDDWEPPATVRMGAGGLEEVPREEESLLMRGEHVAHMLRTRSPRALALATQSHLDFDACAPRRTPSVLRPS